MVSAVLVRDLADSSVCFFCSMGELSQPEIELLGWSEEDKSVHPEAAQLGADLIFGEELYKDLQTIYGSYESTGLYDSVSV